MSKLKIIGTITIFSISILAMIAGILANDTWEVSAGFWMMMYITEKISKE